MAPKAKEVETAAPIAPGNDKTDPDPEQAVAPAPYANQKATEDDDSDSEYTYEPGLISRKCCCLCWIVLALIAGVICALYFTIGPEKAQEIVKGVAPTEPPTAAPTTQLFGDIVDLLIPYTSEETLLDPETPQGQALRQLVKEVEDSGGGGEPIPHRILQRYALMTLYLSTNPSGWTTSSGWTTFSEDECEWYGIGTCRFLQDGTYGVSNIELGKSSLARLIFFKKEKVCTPNANYSFYISGNNGLAGPVPSEICAMAENLESIDVSSNALKGAIPSCLKDFVKLTNLNFSDNNFSGELPTGLLGIFTVSVIDFSQNQLEGNVTSLFGDDTAATNLNTVRLNNNLLTGDFPPSVSSFGGLSTLLLHGNKMSGEVPATVCEMQGLNTFLTTLTADCLEISCKCCTTCY